MSFYHAGRSALRLTALLFIFSEASGAAFAQDNPLIPPTLPGAAPPAAVKPAPPKPTGPPPVARAAALQFQRAFNLQKSGRVAPAIAAYNEFLRLAAIAKLPNSAFVPAYGNLAILYAAQGQRQAQADALHHLLALDSKNTQAQMQLANLDLSMGRVAQGRAEALAVLASAKDPKIIAALRYALANAAMRQKDTAEGIKQYTLALKAQPALYLALMNRCVAYQQLKRYKEALADAKQARNLAPNAMEPRAYIAGLYEEQKNWPAAIAAYGDVLRLEPKNAAMRFRLAAAQQQAKKPQDAIDSYLAVVKIAPDYYPAQLNLGELYYEIGNYADARSHFQSAVKHGPKNVLPPLIGLSLSQVHIAGATNDVTARNATLKSAETNLKQILSLQPENKQAQSALLYAYQLSGKSDAAITLIRQKLAKKPDDVAVVRQLAAEYQAENKPDDALKAWRDYRIHAPNDPVSYQEAARLLQSEKKDEDAVKELQSYAVAHPNDAAMQVTIAQTFMAAGKKDEAKKAYNAVLTADSTGAEISDPKAKEAAVKSAESARLQAVQGLALLAQQDSKWDEAIQYWSQAKTLEAAQAVKNKTEPNVTAYRAIGYAYEQLKKFDLAEREYQSLAQIAPKDPQVQYDLARVYDATNRNDDAIAAYRKASETSGDHLGPLLQIPQLYRRKNEYAKALAEYAELRKKYPTDPRLLAPYAQFAVDQGKDETAVDVYTALLKADASAIYVESLKAAALVRLKRYDEALPLYEAAANRNPDSLDNYEETRKIYELEKTPDAFLPWLQGRLEKNPASRSLMGYFVQQYADRQQESAGLLILKTIVAKHEKEPNVLATYASVLTVRKQNAELENVYQRLAAQNPNDINAKMQYVSALEANGKADDAMKYLEALNDNALLTANFSSANKRSLNQRLAELYKQHGKPDRAIAIYQKAVEEQPDDYTANSILAQALTDANRPAEVIAIYEHLLANPALPTGAQSFLRDRIGSLYEKQNDKPNAIKQYRAALKINAKDAQAADALKRLGRRRNSMNESPTIVILGGPNRAGKSTCAAILIPDSSPVHQCGRHRQNAAEFSVACGGRGSGPDFTAPHGRLRRAES